MLLRRQCGASPSPKSIAWAWPRNARQSLPCPARQSAVNGRNRVRRTTRPRAETAQGPAARGVKPKHPCGGVSVSCSALLQLLQRKEQQPRETTRALRHFQTCRRAAAFFWIAPATPYATPKRHPGDLRHLPQLPRCRARRQLQSPRPGQDTLFGLHRRPRPAQDHAPMGGVRERLWLHRRRLAGSLPAHAQPHCERHGEMGES